LAAFEPLAVVTTTLAGPLTPGGTRQLALVELVAPKLRQATPPIVMPVIPQKLVPAMMTEVPPVESPEAGVTAVTVGGSRDGSGAIVNTSESALAPLPQVQV
jgi:hypothetical protein